jgi:hypothetical protein
MFIPGLITFVLLHLKVNVSQAVHSKIFVNYQRMWECGVMQDGIQYYKLQIQAVWDVTYCHWMDSSQNFEWSEMHLSSQIQAAETTCNLQIKTIWSFEMSEAIYLGAWCNIHQHFNIKKLAWTETYSTGVAFRHAGYNSTKLFSSLELLITPHLHGHSTVRRKTDDSFASSLPTPTCAMIPNLLTHRCHTDCDCTLHYDR